jgi:putative lipoprotein
MRLFCATLLSFTGFFATFCHAERAPDPRELIRVQWLLEDLGGGGVVDLVRSTIRFETEERVAGSGGCNRYFGSVELKGESVKFGPLGTTQMMCDEAVIDQEKRFLAALGKAYKIGIDGAHLLIHSEDLEKPLKFSRLVTDPGERPRND